MAIRYSTFSHLDLGKGIDQQSAENQIADGFSEDLLNVDPLAEGNIRTRRGYQQFAGDLPLRVHKLDYLLGTENNICLTLDGSIDLTTVRSTPIVVASRTSDAHSEGDYTNGLQVVQYPSFSANPRKLFPATYSLPNAPVVGTFTLEQADHGLDSSNLWIEITNSTDTASKNWTDDVVFDEIRIDKNTLDVQIDYATDLAEERWIYTSQKDAQTGSVYHKEMPLKKHLEEVTFTEADIDPILDEVSIPGHNYLTGDNVLLRFNSLGSTSKWVIVIDSNTIAMGNTLDNAYNGIRFNFNDLNPAGTWTSVYQDSTVRITPAEHGFADFNAIARHYVDQGASLVNGFSYIDEFIWREDGNYTIQFGGTTDLAHDSTWTLRTIISQTEDKNSHSFSVNLSGTPTSLVSNALNPAKLEEAFPFYTLYYQDGSDWKQLQFDSSTIEENGDEFDLVFYLNNWTTGISSFRVFWEYGSITSNILKLTGSEVLEAYTDIEPELTVWGIPQADIYGERAAERAGWVSSIDSYRGTFSQRLTSTFAGNLFGQFTQAEAGLQYGMGFLAPNLRARVDGATTVAPAIHPDGSANSRTRGIITATNTVGDNWLTVDSVVYDTSISGANVRVDLQAAAHVLGGTAVSVLDNLEDQLTLKYMGRDILNGNFKIKQLASNGTENIQAWIQIDGITSDRFNELGACGLAGIFTDLVSFTTPNPFILGDRFGVNLFGDTNVILAVGGEDQTTVINGLVDTYVLDDQYKITGQRTSELIPLRDSVDLPTVSGFLKTDQLQFFNEDSDTGLLFSQCPKVLSVNNQPDQVGTTSLDPADGVSVVVSGIDTTNLTVGQKLLCVRSGTYDGIHIIEDIDDSSGVIITDRQPFSLGVTLDFVGQTIEIDEQVEWTDEVDNQYTVAVANRWIPIETPKSSSPLIRSTYTSIFDTNATDLQPFMRSTMVNDNLYFTNGDDEVWKYDGATVYRAGIPYWKPSIFIKRDLDNPTIEPTTSLSVTADIANNWFTTTNKPPFADGDRIMSSYAFDEVRAFAFGTIQTSGFFEFLTVKEVETIITDGAANSYRIKISETLDRYPLISAVDQSVPIRLYDVATYKYYYRINAYDNQRNKIATVGASVASQDSIVEMGPSATIVHKISGFPNFDAYNYDHLELEIYRTLKDSPAPFYLITRQPLSFEQYNRGTIEYADTTSDIALFNEATDTALGDLDPVNTALLGAEIGITWGDAPKSKYLTSVNNRLVLGNLKTYPQLDIVVKSSNVSLTIDPEESAYPTLTKEGQRLWTFRRDNTQTFPNLDTDLVDQLTLEWTDQLISTLYQVGATDYRISINNIQALSRTQYKRISYNTPLDGWVSHGALPAVGPVQSRDSLAVDGGTGLLLRVTHGMLAPVDHQFTTGDKIRFRADGSHYYQVGFLGGTALTQVDIGSVLPSSMSFATEYWAVEHPTEADLFFISSTDPSILTTLVQYDGGNLGSGVFSVHNMDRLIISHQKGTSIFNYPESTWVYLFADLEDVVKVNSFGGDPITNPNLNLRTGKPINPEVLGWWQTSGGGNTNTADRYADDAANVALTTLRTWTIDFPHEDMDTHRSAVTSEYTAFPNGVDPQYASSILYSMAYSSDATHVPVFLGTDGNYETVNGLGIPDDYLNSSYEAVAVRRLADAINWVMRINQEEDFTPWLIARAGASIGYGKLQIQQPTAAPELIEMVTDSAVDDYNIFVNNIQQSNGEQTSASAKLFPSRIHVSYKNYPEIFDNVGSEGGDLDSNTALDINSSDGQQITGLASFFGDSGFTAAQKSDLLIVFKEYSIYAVDIGDSQLLPAVANRTLKKLETHGIGCTAPYSIAVTKDGIIFANESGIYRVNRDLSISYVGQKMERAWKQNTNLANLGLMQGHHWAKEQQYKLSVPIGDEDETSEVYVYNHTREYRDQFGAWSRYDNHPSTGWANLNAEAFFGTTQGRVFQVRNTGETTDYRDDASPITWEVLYKALDFGDGAVRKVVGSLVTHFRPLSTSSNTTLDMAIDLNTDFEDMDSFVIKADGSSDQLSDNSFKKIQSISFSLPTRRALYFQLRFQGSGMDEPVEIVGIDWRISGLNEAGIQKAADTL